MSDMLMRKKFGEDRRCFTNIVTRRASKHFGRWTKARTGLRRLWNDIYRGQIKAMRRGIKTTPQTMGE